jgi:membrane protein DedA with SNARE-associated domain
MELFMFTIIEDFLINNLQSIYDTIGWLGVTGLLVFENATGITPSEIILGLAGWMLLAAHDAPFISVFLWGVVAAIGSAIGASITYWAARVGGRPLVDRMFRWFRIDLEKAQQAETQFQNWGMGFMLIGRMIPGVRTIINIPAGLARMPYIRFLVYTLIGSYIWCTLLIGIGYFLGYEWWLISDFVKQGAPWLFATGILVLIGAYVWKLSRKRRVIRNSNLTAGD